MPKVGVMNILSKRNISYKLQNYKEDRKFTIDSEYIIFIGVKMKMLDT